jgi:hypothetical protein
VWRWAVNAMLVSDSNSLEEEHDVQQGWNIQRRRMYVKPVM